MVTPNYFRILNVTSEVDDEGLKSAYRQRSRATHPDHGGSAEAFHEVNEAYQVLSDPVRRREWIRKYVLEAASFGHVVCERCFVVNRVRAFKPGEAAYCAKCRTRLAITPEERNARYKEAVKDTIGDLLLTIGAESGELAKDAIVYGAQAIRRRFKLGRT